MNLRFSSASFILICLAGWTDDAVEAFSPSKLMTFRCNTHVTSSKTNSAAGFDLPTKLFASSDDEKSQRMQEIFKEEASNVNSMKAAAEQMKNLKPEDMDRMLQEMDNMNPLQKQALKAMGMNPDMMKQTLSMMRDNPQMIDSATKLMENMTPEQMMESSRMAQERMASMSKEEIEQASQAMKNIDKEKLDEAVEVIAKSQKQEQQRSQNVVDAEVADDDDDDDDNIRPERKEPIATGPGTSSDPKVIDLMYKMAEMMSDPYEEDGGVTLAGFYSIPVVQLLSGEQEEDLSMAELKECWASGSLGATRVKRDGFERIWNELQDMFDDEIMNEARTEARFNVKPQKKRRGNTQKSSKVAPDATLNAIADPSTAAAIGQNMSAEQLKAVNEQVKNMSDSDVDSVLEAMEKMDPIQEARMRSMGVDPEKMKQAAKMMKNNPMMRKAAQSMMSNMSPEQMLQMSRQAQKDMQNKQ